MVLQTKNILRTSLRFCSVLLVCGSWNAFANPTPDMCIKAMNNTKGYFEGAQNIAEQQYNNREINRGQFKTRQSELKNIQNRISLEKCMESTLQELALFQCLADDGGNYPACESGSSEQ